MISVLYTLSVNLSLVRSSTCPTSFVPNLCSTGCTTFLLFQVHPIALHFHVNEDLVVILPCEALYLAIIIRENVILIPVATSECGEPFTLPDDNIGAVVDQPVKANIKDPLEEHEFFRRAWVEVGFMKLIEQYHNWLNS